MIVIFTDEEKEWLDREPFNWHAAKGAPETIRQSLEEKLKVMNQQATMERRARGSKGSR